MELKVMYDTGAFMLQRAHTTDAGLDIRTPRSVTIWPRDREFIDTGIHIQLPEGMEGHIRPKSGLMKKYGILTDGTIDEGYSGSIGVVLFILQIQKYLSIRVIRSRSL